MEKFKRPSPSWFWKLFLNSKTVTGLIILILVLLAIFLFNKVSYLFTPIFQFIGIIGAPLVFAGILYYLLEPVVSFLEKKGLSRVWSISLIFVAIVALLVWGIVILFPMLQEQIISFSNNWPDYWETIQNKGSDILKHPLLAQYADQIEKVSKNFFDSFGSMIQKFSKNTVSGIGSLIGVMTTIFLTIATGPIILFYLLKDGKQLSLYIEKFLPSKSKKPIMQVLTDINEKVSSYIRGQLVVAFVVAILFMIGFKIVGLEYGVTLGILAGFMNLIPYLGSFLAMIPAIILAIVAGPMMIVKVLIVFSVEQFIEGRFVSPLILGNQLEIHPITIIFVLLTSGKVFGVAGVILGVPGYAAIKVIVTHAFSWYIAHSRLYDVEDKERLIKKPEA
ncbi:AI-2E family transporter [Vagococcus xieshaowenii]|uniref:AI-2E family transporter n=2 Tax=Vagococcus xieshaowenii TaxID=2562451 RepID=A0AAJ5JLI0_9ENTE|nr:AI-2E family transporter [Vagococcus xieshaowenii]QCA28129.1 AI-2E family transporter [Vagococcus xieshaowenii]TFZ40173.1 AI-2E family transporter [Vagococcus xieshaowenii]